MEVLINTTAMTFQLQIKSENEEIPPFIAKYVEYCCQMWGTL